VPLEVSQSPAEPLPQPRELHEVAPRPAAAEAVDAPLVADALRRRWILSASVVLIFMTGVEGTVIATALPTIVGHLGGFAEFSWVFSAYYLAQGVTIPIYGRLADLLGRKRVLLFGLTLFLVGTTLCGLSQSMGMLVIFRLLQGTGAGAVQPINQTLIGDLYPPVMRAKLAGFFSSIWGMAAIVGPMLGAFVIAHIAWYWVFWVTVPIGVVAFGVLVFALHEKIERHAHKIDYAGAAALSLSIGLLMYAFIDGRELGLADFMLLLALAAGVFTLFILRERVAAEPILPLGLFGRPVITNANIACFGVGCVVMASTTFLPAYIQGVMGDSPMVAGYALAISSVTWIAGSWMGGRIMLRRSYRTATAVGGLFLIPGIAMLITLDPARGALWAAAGTSLVGTGMGLTQNTYTVATQSCVDWNQRGIATSLIAFNRMLGQTVGTALYGGIVNFTLADLVGGNAISRIMDPALRDSLGPARLGPVMAAVADAVHNVYLTAALFVLVVLAAGYFLPKGLSPVRAAYSKSRE
jgi:EmrB/QacA subfamily drug resistance transporter